MLQVTWKCLAIPQEALVHVGPQKGVRDARVARLLQVRVKKESRERNHDSLTLSLLNSSV